MFFAAACRAAPPPQKGICGRRIFWLPIFHVYVSARKNVTAAAKKPSAARFVMKNRANAYNRGKTARGKRIKTRHARPFARRAEVFTFIYLPLPAIFAIIIWQKSEKCRFICRPRLSGAKKLSICAEEGTAIRGLHFRIRINTFFFTDIPLSEIRWRSLWKGRSFLLPATSPFWRYW